MDFSIIINIIFVPTFNSFKNFYHLYLTILYIFKISLTFFIFKYFFFIFHSKYFFFISSWFCLMAAIVIFFCLRVIITWFCLFFSFFFCSYYNSIFRVLFLFLYRICLSLGLVFYYSRVLTLNLGLLRQTET